MEASLALFLTFGLIIGTIVVSLIVVYLLIKCCNSISNRNREELLSTFNGVIDKNFVNYHIFSVLKRFPKSSEVVSAAEKYRYELKSNGDYDGIVGFCLFMTGECELDTMTNIWTMSTVFDHLIRNNRSSCIFNIYDNEHISIFKDNVGNYFDVPLVDNPDSRQSESCQVLKIWDKDTQYFLLKVRGARYEPYLCRVKRTSTKNKSAKTSRGLSRDTSNDSSDYSYSYSSEC